MDMARRIRVRRLRQAWTQGEMAERAGVKLATYIHFERTGRISLLRLLKVADTLGLLDEFDQIGRSEDLTHATLRDVVAPERRRGRRRRL